MWETVHLRDEICAKNRRVACQDEGFQREAERVVPDLVRRCLRILSGSPVDRDIPLFNLLNGSQCWQGSPVRFDLDRLCDIRGNALGNEEHSQGRRKR